MIIYCHSTLDETLRDKLITAISPRHEIHFRAHLESDEEAGTFFRKAHFILGNPPVEWFQNTSPDLTYWQLDSAGFDQYTSLQLPENIKVANMGNWFARPCAETIVGGVVALYRGLDRLTLLKQKSEWVGSDMRSDLRILFQQNVIILGAGTIAQAVNSILKGFGCYTHMLSRTSPEADLHSREDLFHELPHADLVINTLPGTAVNYANADFFRAIKRGAVYASVGRGSTTNESALIEALDSKHLDGAVLDVTEVEPLPENSPLWKIENVLLTQHTGGGRKDEHLGKVDLFLNNIFAIENGSTVIDQINLSRGY